MMRCGGFHCAVDSVHSIVTGSMHCGRLAVTALFGMQWYRGCEESLASLQVCRALSHCKCTETHDPNLWRMANSRAGPHSSSQESGQDPQPPSMSFGVKFLKSQQKQSHQHPKCLHCCGPHSSQSMPPQPGIMPQDTQSRVHISRVSASSWRPGHA
jgi:hypothetical protein